MRVEADNVALSAVRATIDKTERVVVAVVVAEAAAGAGVGARRLQRGKFRSVSGCRVVKGCVEDSNGSFGGTKMYSQQKILHWTKN